MDAFHHPSPPRVHERLAEEVVSVLTGNRRPGALRPRRPRWHRPRRPRPAAPRRRDPALPRGRDDDRGIRLTPGDAKTPGRTLVSPLLPHRDLRPAPAYLAFRWPLRARTTIGGRDPTAQATCPRVPRFTAGLSTVRPRPGCTTGKQGMRRRAIGSGDRPSTQGEGCRARRHPAPSRGS